MTRRARLLLALSAFILPVWAETAAERGRRVVDEALQAVGGDRFLQMQDRLESGRAYSFYREQISGLSVAKIYTRYLVRPEPPVSGALNIRERETFGKDESNYLLFTDAGAWEATYRGARPLDEERIKNYRESTLLNIFYILRERLGEPGLTFYSQGSDIVENVPVEIVDITDGDGRTVTVSFSQFTKLPVRQVFRRRNTQYKDFDREVTAFSKYRDSGNGIMWPWDIRRERNGEKIFEMYSDSVEINRDLKDNLFTLPGNLKILPPAK